MTATAAKHLIRTCVCVVFLDTWRSHLYANFRKFAFFHQRVARVVVVVYIRRLRTHARFVIARVVVVVAVVTRPAPPSVQELLAAGTVCAQ